MEPIIPVRAQLFAIAGCLLLFGLVLGLVRQRRLREEYSILWLGVTAGTAVLATWGGLLVWLTHLVGALSANSVIFFFGLLFLTVLLLHLTVRVSGLMEQNKDLAQEVSLLGGRLESLERVPVSERGRNA